jgi:hypothetical protein
MRSPTSVQHANSRIPAKARGRLSGRKRGDKTRGHPAREVTSQNVPGTASGSEANANTSTERMGEGKDMVPECPPVKIQFGRIGIKSSLLCLRSTHHIPNQLIMYPDVSGSGVPLFSGAGTYGCGMGRSVHTHSAPHSRSRHLHLSAISSSGAKKTS